MHQQLRCRRKWCFHPVMMMPTHQEHWWQEIQGVEEGSEQCISLWERWLSNLHWRSFENDVKPQPRHKSEKQSPLCTNPIWGGDLWAAKPRGSKDGEGKSQRTDNSTVKLLGIIQRSAHTEITHQTRKKGVFLSASKMRQTNWTQILKRWLTW